ncbi:hypothetical protein [Caldisalinibacter kiritimatiensis]|uniref:Uncharacterized protein n=1 Tax=Caldisalinibacter kiritimatiensis TaxID=1304284 RepID=R1CP42_9FIRM|nr:hypothetical protein [Caldisalinibacter kiritimatiensis]EOD00461.1 hypothetical protein L21TH_1491 [Caldisalinibacter kiritimatiensis]
MKKFLSLILSFVMLFTLSISAFAAEPQMTVDEAREYLQSYYVTKENSVGKEYSIQYIFNSDEDLEKAAIYLSENGLSAFNATVDTAIEEVVSKEPKSPQTRSTTPTTGYATVSGDGNHYVSSEAYGLASFDSLGTVEYLVELGYSVTVSNGVFTDLTSISFDIPYISAAGSWGNTRFPSYCTDTSAGVTANYDITKSVEIGVGDFSFVIKTETDNEIFALLTSIA